MVDADKDHLALIMLLSGLIRQQLASYDERRFLDDRDAIDSTAYRVLSIGEATKNLSGSFKNRHGHVDWRAISGMRDVLAHNYEGVFPLYLWRVYTNDLQQLIDLARAELDVKP